MAGGKEKCAYIRGDSKLLVAPVPDLTPSSGLSRQLCVCPCMCACACARVRARTHTSKILTINI